MKKTIKFLSMAALALVGAMTAGCSSDDNIISQPQQPENKNNVVTLTTTVGFDDAAGTTRALAIDYENKNLTKTFKAGDQIAVVYENTSNTMVKAESVALTEGNITAEGKSATFTVTLTDPKASGTVKYIYPAAMAGETDVDYTNLNSQDGTLETIASNLDLAVYEGNLTSDVKLPAPASLENKLAIIAYTIKDNAATPNDLTSTITGMTLSDGTNNYEVTRSAAAGPIYVAIQPTSEADIEYTATNGTKNYAKSVTGKTYAAGEFYQLGLKMVAPAVILANSTVGMIVGTDGKAYAAADKDNLPTGVTAVAMVAYKSATTGSSLAIALADEASDMGWSTAKSTCEGKTAITGGTWKLPSQNDWKQMFNAFGGSEDSYTGLNTALATAGGDGSKLHEGANEAGLYWTSTENGVSNAYAVSLNSGVTWHVNNRGYNRHVRACLAF